MKLYADDRVRRGRQLAGDALLVLWVVAWVQVGRGLHHATLALAAPGREVQDAGTGLAGRLRDAGTAVGDVPLVGSKARAPFDGAGRAADQLASAGRAQVAAVHDLALWLGIAVAAIPVIVVVAFYLPARWRFAREASAAQRFVDSDDDLALFALRAMARQPMHRLARVSDDPVGAWRAADPDVVRRLAMLELRESGLRPPGE